MIIRPCCAHKELPPYIVNNEDHIAIFNTNGDVHFEKLYSSVACILEGKTTLTLIMPKVTRMMMRYIRHCFDRGWVTDLNLRTSTDQSILVCQELGECLFRRHTIYLYSSMVTDSSAFFMLKDEHESSLTITGYFPPEPLTDIKKKPQSVTHTMLYTQNAETDDLLALTHAVLSPFHIEKVRRAKQEKEGATKCEQCPNSFINFETGKRECSSSTSSSRHPLPKEE